MNIRDRTDIPEPPVLHWLGFTPAERRLLLRALDMLDDVVGESDVAAFESMVKKATYTAPATRTVRISLPAKDCYSILSGEAWDGQQLSRLRKACVAGLEGADLPTVLPGVE
ncbi:MAG: hypothetical protein ACPHCN_09330 [Mycobacterium sp.]